MSRNLRVLQKSQVRQLSNRRAGAAGGDGHRARVVSSCRYVGFLFRCYSDPAFRNGRQLAAWLGLVPRQHSSGGKDRLSGITKAGNTYIRRLLVIGATSVIRYARSKAPGTAEWLKKLLDRKSARLASVALANKMARIAWSVLTRGEVYRNTYPVPKPT